MGRKSFWYYWLLLTGVLILAGVACEEGTPGPTAEGRAVATPVPTPASAILPNLLIQTEGQVALRRLDWYDYRPAPFGVELQPGDLLRIGPGGRALIFCGEIGILDQNPIPMGEGDHQPIPCSSWRPIPLEDLAPPRGGLESIPYVIFPRATRLLNPRPTLRWHLLTGITTYTVSIRGREGIVASAQVQGNVWPYPSHLPPLSPGESYQVIVEANGYSSEEDPTPWTGFTLLSEEEAAAVHRLRERLEALPLEESARRLLTVHLYTAYELRGEALELLQGDALIQQEPVPARLLADLYFDTALYDEAWTAYQQALQRAEQWGDSEGVGLALVGLGLTSHHLGDTASAVRFLEQAKAFFEALGDRRRTERIEEILQGLQGP